VRSKTVSDMERLDHDAEMAAHGAAEEAM